MNHQYTSTKHQYNLSVGCQSTSGTTPPFLRGRVLLLVLPRVGGKTNIGSFQALPLHGPAGTFGPISSAAQKTISELRDQRDELRTELTNARSSVCGMISDLDSNVAKLLNRLEALKTDPTRADIA